MNQSFVHSNSDFARSDYWDQRFEDEEAFEWLKGYKEFGEMIKKYAKATDKILIIGCGNSDLGIDMHMDGFIDITNMDYSNVVIEKMKKKHAGIKGMIYIWSNMLDMKEFSDESFDLVLEKATLEVLSVEEMSVWNPSNKYLDNMKTVLSEISRVLKPSGRFLSISFTQPHFRIPFLADESFKWSVSVEQYGTAFHYFFYIMQKGDQLSFEHSNTHNCFFIRIRAGYIPPLQYLEESDDSNFLLNISL